MWPTLLNVFPPVTEEQPAAGRSQSRLESCDRGSSQMEGWDIRDCDLQGSPPTGLCIGEVCMQSMGTKDFVPQS